MHTIRLKDDYIKLGQALKAAGVVESGVCKICRTGRSGKSKRTDRNTAWQKTGIRR